MDSRSAEFDQIRAPSTISPNKISSSKILDIAQEIIDLLFDDGGV
jgi:hypothetical protein